MTISNQEELEGMKAAGKVVARVLGALVPKVKAGVTTGELDRVAEAMLEGFEARSAPRMVYGFPGSVLVSVNDEVVHGIPGERVLQGGDVVTVDVTVEKDGFMADAARTVLVPYASVEKKRLAACARVAFSEAMKVARAGNRVRDVGAAIERTAHRHGFSSIRDLCGHGIGRTIHEPPEVPGIDYEGATQVLEEGMVLAVEPMISTGADLTRLDPDGWTIRTTDGSLSAHYENTIVITKGRPLVLTMA